MQNSTAYLQVEVDYRRKQLSRSWGPLFGRRTRQARPQTRNELRDGGTSSAA